MDNFSKRQLSKLVKESSSFHELILKLGYGTRSGSNNITIKKRLDDYGIDYSHFGNYKKVKRSEENIFIENSTATQKVLREWYLKGNYTEYKCSICGLEPIWMGKKLTLILDHINGINTDDRLENLRWVCPNCNQQLDTTNGKNIKNKRKSNKIIKVYYKNCGKEITKNSKTQLCKNCSAFEKRVCERPSKEELLDMIKEKSFTEISKKYGVSDNAVRKWCKNYNLPFKKSDIKKIKK